ncbi:hypothetical protein, partial [Klebsiella pneumoniae]|uniref:hypothetical protein n=1 Tax=Klebsiella pneumoniae TaxID=573 RepID=UPI003B982862
MYFVVGQFMAMAVRSKNLLSLKFPRMFWKIFCWETVGEKDIEEIDISGLKLIGELEREIAARQRRERKTSDI